jgi:hypothetical protein
VPQLRVARAFLETLGIEACKPAQVAEAEEPGASARGCSGSWPATSRSSAWGTRRISWRVPSSQCSRSVRVGASTTTVRPWATGIAGSHAGYMSQPQAVATLIDKAARTVVAKAR